MESREGVRKDDRAGQDMGREKGFTAHRTVAWLSGKIPSDGRQFKHRPTWRIPKDSAPTGFRTTLSRRGSNPLCACVGRGVSCVYLCDNMFTTNPTVQVRFCEGTGARNHTLVWDLAPSVFYT